MVMHLKTVLGNVSWDVSRNVFSFRKLFLEEH